MIRPVLYLVFLLPAVVSGLRSSTLPSSSFPLSSSPLRFLALASVANDDNSRSSAMNGRNAKMTAEKDACDSGCIQNFRPGAGLDSIVFRCGSTDDLATYASSSSLPQSKSDSLVYENAGLVLDLRSPSERDAAKTASWTQSAPNGPINVLSFTTTDASAIILKQLQKSSNDSQQQQQNRFVVHIDVLSPQRFMTYITKNWLTSSKEQFQVGWYKLTDGNALHALRIEKLNARGLAGLNEAILETGKIELKFALECITVYLEAGGNTSSWKRPIVIHCVKGKDRTGMLAMLLQSIIDVNEEMIITDYAKSNDAYVNEVKPTAAMAGQERSGRLDKSKFAGANRESMMETLAFLKSKYGSVIGYLDDIGFDEEWRRRLARVLLIGGGGGDDDAAAQRSPQSKL